uniref:Putative transferrin 1 n=1 Tax=Anopheles darlingi TaxID=43151 RepID=A0A2M4DN52_ANODA
MVSQEFRLSSLVCLLALLVVAAQGQPYRWCVPFKQLAICQRLTGAEGIRNLGCVAGNDRLDCLRKVQSREADFVAVDPEDAYVAVNMNNEDFVLFAELRTTEEPTAEFRYEGIVLVRTADGFTSMDQLRGKKSCHTGYGRNVGYKIPVTKLRQMGIFKMPTERNRSPLENELAGLSELFSSSCLVGTYSPNADIDRLLKKRYSNLCERCAEPERCAVNDRFSGYEGAIRCLVENDGDVAFTKTIFVRKYFGLPITPGAVAKPAVNPAVRAEDYSYLCEDGTTRPVSDQNVCSWAQRPWPAFMANGDLTGNRVQELQSLLQTFYRQFTDASVSAADLEAARKLSVDREHLIVNREQVILPQQYLERAKYKDVIERETAYDFKFRLCVSTEAERQKCDQMQRAAYARDVRPSFECVLKGGDACVAAVQNGDADAVVLKEPSAALKPIVWEKYDDAVTNVDKDANGRGRTAVYIRKEVDETVQDNIVHAFTAISNAFGRRKRNEIVFTLFGPFRLSDAPGNVQVQNLIFNDQASALVSTPVT